LTQAEFVEATTRMEQYYEKELNIEQRKFWYENLKNLPVENYRKITYELMKNCKFFPKFADIQEIRKNTQFSSKKTEKEKIHEKCEICGGAGIIQYYKSIKNGEKDLKYLYVAKCKCRNRENYDWRDKEGNSIIQDAVELNLI